MIASLKPFIANLRLKIEPQFKRVIERWNQLQPREQKMVGGLGICLAITLLFMIITGVVAYKARMDMALKNLNSFVVFSRQAALNYKTIKGVEANSFTSVSTDQIKGDVSQVLQVKDPDILIQDGQMTISVPNAQFSQVVTLIDQLRRSYAIFPSQLTITKQTRAGYVSFNATFWVKQ